MRASEFIFEARNYMDMFNSMLEKWPQEWRKESMRDHVEAQIKNAKSIGRLDRITWYLQHVKYDILESYILDRRDSEKPVENWIARDFKKLKNKFGYQLPDDPFESTVNVGVLFDSLQHFLSLGIQEIDEYRFDNQSLQTVMQDFERFEHRWKKKVQGAGVKIKHGDEMIIKIDEDTGWWLLDRGACDAEGESMGHCGNKPSEKKGDRILSFRSKVSDEVWKPHLTFILDKAGYLGEMKGRGNEKPAPKYWSAIIQLLEHPIVKGIKGGGYLHENNFDISELPREKIVSLYNKKPQLFEHLDDESTVKLYAKHGFANPIKSRIKQDPSITLLISRSDVSRSQFYKLLQYAARIDGNILRPNSNMRIDYLWIGHALKTNDIPASVWRTAIRNGLDPKYAPVANPHKSKDKEKWQQERDVWQDLLNKYPDDIKPETIPPHIRNIVNYQE